ncbi:MAG: hypothetical protein KatS3mg095_0808 [Candidatus Parcubacteria bacterium]|nr:MAG: hypothetical protein KatS3mg095_0808 [Candidatus Parcubacteria bacterium]
MDINNQELIKYIQLSLVQGKSKEEIYKELLNLGWEVDVIQDAFNQIVTKEEKEDIQKRIIRIIVTIGAILVGLGIFAFVAANWQEMTKAMKVLIIVIAMTASYTGGWFLREKWHSPKTGEALILLGSIIYGAGIFLVGQMFNIRVNWPDGFILWMIGTIFMAFAVKSFPLFYLAILVGIAAIVNYIFSLTYFVLLLTATIVTFITGWLVKKRIPPELKEFY